MNLEDLEKIDSKKMFQIYDKWPSIAKESFQQKNEKLYVKDIDHIVFVGMGGSGSIGDVISSVLSKKNIHVTNVKGYLLPKTVDSKTLVIAISVSGDTNETLTILESAKKSSAKIAAFASGGLMEEYCKKNNVFFQKIPMIHSPRASFTKFLYSILNVLQEIILIDDNDIKNSIKSLEKTRDSISSNNLNQNNTSLRLANWIKQIPLIYYPWGLQAAAIRFKNSLQENSKIHVITEDIIEASHNGVVSWERNSNVQPILLRGYNDHLKTIERWEIIKEYFSEKGIDHFEINSGEGDIFSKIVSLIYLLDYASIYHAVLHKIDPSPVNAIDFIKNKL